MVTWLCYCWIGCTVVFLFDGLVDCCLAIILSIVLIVLFDLIYLCFGLLGWIWLCLMVFAAVWFWFGFWVVDLTFVKVTLGVCLWIGCGLCVGCICYALDFIACVVLFGLYLCLFWFLLFVLLFFVLFDRLLVFRLYLCID